MVYAQRTPWFLDPGQEIVLVICALILLAVIICLSLRIRSMKAGRSGARRRR